MRFSMHRRVPPEASTLPQGIDASGSLANELWLKSDYDEDRSNDIDTITVEVAVNDGESIQLEASETGPNTGIFTREIDTSDTAAENVLIVQQGDVVYLRYLDSQNTFPGHTVPRERAVYM